MLRIVRRVVLAWTPMRAVFHSAVVSALLLACCSSRTLFLVPTFIHLVATVLSLFLV
jgi:hypothetical protein